MRPVGEMRDSKTIRLAMTVAEIGYLVFGIAAHVECGWRPSTGSSTCSPPKKRSSGAVRIAAGRHLTNPVQPATVSAAWSVHEIMLGTSAIRNLIREAKVAQMYSTIQTSNSVGMQTLDQNLTDLVRRNIISPAEARSKAKIPENFPVDVSSTV